VIPERQEFAKKLRAEHGDKSLGEIKVENVFGGMRGLKVMLWEPSVLDADEGIRFWGRSIPECQEVLPKAPGGKQMLPESMLFYLSACCPAAVAGRDPPCLTLISLRSQ
jgi:citrate synthase